MTLIRGSAGAVTMGPFVNSADGVSPVVGLTPSFHSSSNGGAFSPIAASGVDIGNGYYSLTLAAGETGSVGTFKVRADDDPGYLPVFETFEIAGEAMAQFQRTSQVAAVGVAGATVHVGRFVSVLNRQPLLAGFSYANAIGQIIKADGSVVPITFVTSGATGPQRNMTNVGAGFYKLELNASDVDRPGALLIMIEDATTFFPVLQEAQVIAAATVFDGLFSASGNEVIASDVVQALGQAVAAPGGMLTVDIGAVIGDVAKAAQFAAAILATGLMGTDLKEIGAQPGAATNLQTACNGGSYNLGGGGVRSDLWKVGGLDVAHELARWLQTLVLFKVAAAPVPTTTVFGAAEFLDNPSTNGYAGRVCVFPKLVGTAGNRATGKAVTASSAGTITVAALPVAPDVDDIGILI